MSKTTTKRVGHDQSPKTREAAIRNWWVFRLNGVRQTIINCPFIESDLKTANKLFQAIDAAILTAKYKK